VRVSDEPEDPPLAPVVRIRPGVDLTDEERPLARKPRKPDELYCRHWRLELDHEQELVFCRDCGRQVPAFHALEELHRHWDRFIMGRQEAERRMEVARMNLADLERREANAKARIRNAERRGDPEVVKALRDLVRLAKQRGRGAYSDDGAWNEALREADVALYRHGRQRAREVEQEERRAAPPPPAAADDPL
jgi:hypothetical protein